MTGLDLFKPSSDYINCWIEYVYLSLSLSLCVCVGMEGGRYERVYFSSLTYLKMWANESDSIRWTTKKISSIFMIVKRTIVTPDLSDDSWHTLLCTGHLQSWGLLIGNQMCPGQHNYFSLPWHLVVEHGPDSEGTSSIPETNYIHLSRVYFTVLSSVTSSG